MTTDPTASAPASRGIDVARAEIRDDEAQRLLGMLAAGTLPGRATQWITDGVVDDAVSQLAEATTNSEDERAALLARAAASLGLGFASQRDARAHHGQRVIQSMTAASAPADSLGYSNAFSDTIEESVRDSIARLFKPRG